MKRVLITPLDWGLGHATRCIPVIRELQRQGCEVVIGGSGDALALLEREFPGSAFVPLPAYAPRYPARGSMVWTMARQLPRFTGVISSEHKATGNIVESGGIDLIISDNRYGCWSDKVPSVFITHQSNVLMPKRFGFLQGFVRKMNERLISRFDACWIPDVPATDSLAGELISFGKFNFSTRVDFIGWLSRFDATYPSRNTEFDVLVILSGPEPQRTLFEATVTPQLKNSSLKFRVVRGLPSAGNGSSQDERFVDFMTTSELQASIESSAVVIARSGYSTVMDMMALGKKAIFVPTPNQTEQEYLAARLMEKGIAYAMPQDKFDLDTALEENKKYSGFPVAPGKNGLLREAVSRVLNK